MLVWELKKIIKNKSSIIVLVLMGLLFIQIGFIKPMLETENEYYDESKNEYIIDQRSENIIAQEKLDNKVSELKLLANKNTHGLKDESEKQISQISKSKLKNDDGNVYKDIAFYQVFEERVTFPLATLLIVAIIVTISSNLYTEEKLSSIDSIILSSKNKSKTLSSKLLVSISTPIFIYGIYMMLTFMITYIQYGAPINGELQAYRISSIATLVRDMSINQYILSDIGVMVLVFMVISVFSALFSFITSNSIQCISASIVFIASTKIIAYLKFLPDKFITIVSQISFIDILSRQSFISTMYMGNINLFSLSFDLSKLCIYTLAILIVVGITLNIYVFKKILSK